MYKLDVDGFQPIKDQDLDSMAQSLPAHRVAIRLVSQDGQQYDHIACTGSKIFAFDCGGGSSMMYDSKTSTVAICPPLVAPKGGTHRTPELLAVGNDIYALETNANLHGFHRWLEKLGPAPRSRGREEWRWQPLPRPPFKLPVYISSTAMHPDGSTLFLSFSDRGTFSFDTDSLAWTRLGDWLLPFRGEAYFVRELDAWVGLSDQLGYIGVCQVISPDGRPADRPTWTTVRERVYTNLCRRYRSASLTYMGNAEFCLLENLTREGHQNCTDDDPKMLLRLATFRVERRRNHELRAVNMRTRVYKWPHRDVGELSPTAFWISQDD